MPRLRGDTPATNAVATILDMLFWWFWVKGGGGGSSASTPCEHQEAEVTDYAEDGTPVTYIDTSVCPCACPRCAECRSQDPEEAMEQAAADQYGGY